MIKMLTKCFAIVTAVILIAMPTTSSYAQPAWYYGTIKRLYLFKTGFVITMNSTALDDCLHKYVYFSDITLGETAVSRAYSMILTAMSTEKSVGVVIDKAINGSGGRCDSNGSVDIKD